MTKLQWEINAEIEAIAVMIEDEDGWSPVYYSDSDRPTQSSHVDLLATLAAIAAAVRKRKTEILPITAKNVHNTFSPSG